jgi:hypothetical protein
MEYKLVRVIIKEAEGIKQPISCIVPWVVGEEFIQLCREEKVDGLNVFTSLREYPQETQE